MDDPSPPRRGFAAMDPERRKAIAKLGGSSVPADKRSFSVSRDLAAQAGSKGGPLVPAEKRSFSRDKELASKAGAAGGRVARTTVSPLLVSSTVQNEDPSSR